MDRNKFWMKSIKEIDIDNHDIHVLGARKKIRDSSIDFVRGIAEAAKTQGSIKLSVKIIGS